MVGLTPHPHLVPKVLEKNRAIPVLTLRVCVAYKRGENLPILNDIREYHMDGFCFPIF